MLSNSPIMAFVATSEPDRTRSFYEDVLGLQLVSDDPFAIVFECHGIMLRVQKVEWFEPHSFTALGWQVEDIETAVRDLKSRGVVFERYDFVEEPEGIWTAPGGARIAWFKDPCGNLLSLTEFP